jgi:predicted nucleic acid-binding protein
LLSGDASKADRAEALVAAGGIISVQVLNEFASVSSRKLGMLWPEIREVLETIRAVCRVEPLGLETHDLGLALAERYGFSIYDGTILASAQLADCRVVFTEDLQHGQVRGCKKFCVLSHDSDPRRVPWQDARSPRLTTT